MFVSHTQTFENLDGNIKQLSYLLRSFGSPLCMDELLNCLPFEQRHHNEGLACMFAKFINGTDVGMFQR